MAIRRKSGKSARQAPKASRKVLPPPPKAKRAPAAPKSARKPTPKPPPSAPKAKPPALPSAKLPKAAAPKAAPVDPFDVRPTAYIPGVYMGRYKGEGGHTCVAYKRTEFKVSTIMGGQPIHLHEWGIEDFDQMMTPLKLHGKPYPVQRAIAIHLKSLNGWTDKAVKALKQMRDGKEVDINGEDTLDDILDTSPAKTTKVKVHRQALSKDDRRLKRKLRRLEKIQKMTPAERVAWQAKRNARRKARKAARLAARQA